jgi:hypothetical protein
VIILGVILLVVGQAMSARLTLAPPALTSLNGPGHYLHWGFIQMSYANAIVIVSMVAVFALALFLPFPGGRR